MNKQNKFSIYFALVLMIPIIIFYLPDYGILINDADIFDFNGKNIVKLDKGNRVNFLFNADKYWKIQNNDGEAFVFKSDVKILPDFKP